MSARGPALVLALGNPLRGDDGAGPAVAEALAADEGPALRVRALHQLGPELAEEVAAAPAVVVVDARAGGPAGEVREEPLAPGARPAALSHALDPGALLGLAARLYGRCPPAALVTVAGAAWGLAEGLSPAVRAAVPEARARVLAALRRLHEA